MTSFLACLNGHAPIKTVKLRRKSNLAITTEIRGTHKIKEPAPQEGSAKQIWSGLGSIRPSRASNKDEQVTANKGDSGCIWKTIRRVIPTNPTQFHQYTKATSTLTNEFNGFSSFFFFHFFRWKRGKKLKDLQDNVA